MHDLAIAARPDISLLEQMIEKRQDRSPGARLPQPTEPVTHPHGRRRDGIARPRDPGSQHRDLGTGTRPNRYISTILERWLIRPQSPEPYQRRGSSGS
jgi:hypothetical protein